MHFSSATRRQFLQRSAMTAGACAVAAINNPALGYVSGRTISGLRESLSDARANPLGNDPITKDPRVKQVLQRAIEAAVAGGASYAEARLTHSRARLFPGAMIHPPQNLSSIHYTSVTDSEEISVGVRALVRGYWGFAAGPVWTVVEGDRLGTAAAKQAFENARGKPREMALAPRPIATGDWTIPVQIDPFTLHPNQVGDIVNGLAMYASTKKFVQMAFAGAMANCQDRALATSDGTYVTQRVRWMGTSLKLKCEEDISSFELSSANVGLEVLDEDRMRAAVDPLIEEMRWVASLPILPLEVGRYATVLGTKPTGSILRGSIGIATQLDRVLGYEANASGTSFLDDPIQMLGNYVMGPALLSVTAERSTQSSAATVKWDDEGVMPVDTLLVKNGILTNYQTTRETAAWLAAEKPGFVAASTGGASAPTGADVPMNHTANLTMHPGTEALNATSLIRDMKKGMYFKDGGADFDFQQLHVEGGGQFFEVANGKVVARLVNASPMFKSTEFWKGVRAIGGPESRESQVIGDSIGSGKGEPPQAESSTITTVPILHEGLTYIDRTRKA